MANDELTFDKLVDSIRQVHKQLASQAGRAVNISLTLRNWMFGLYIAEFELRGKDRAVYGDKLFVDLVFYHRILKCHVLVELKVDIFTHEHIGQLNTYVSWYKKNEMTAGDNPPIGILLCTQKDHTLVEYALAGSLDGK